MKYDAWIKIRQEKYIYLHTSDTIFKTKEDCIEESYYECAASKVIKKNFQGWESNVTHCFPSHLANLVSNDTNIQCENEDQDETALYQFINYDFYNSNCPKSCSIVQYTGKLDYWDSWERKPNDSIFSLKVRFAPPLTTTVYEEYLIYDIFGMIGSVGGTLGIFIEFSCSGLFSFITSIFKKCKYQTLKRAIYKVHNCCGAKCTQHNENNLEYVEKEG